MYIINNWTHLCWGWMSFPSLKLQQSLAPTELWNFPSFHLFTSDLPLLPSNRADQLPIIINFKYKHLTLRTNNKQSNKKTSPRKEPRIYLQSPQMSGPVSLESEIISSLLTVWSETPAQTQEQEWDLQRPPWHERVWLFQGMRWERYSQQLLSMSVQSSRENKRGGKPLLDITQICRKFSISCFHTDDSRRVSAFLLHLRVPEQVSHHAGGDRSCKDFII